MMAVGSRRPRFLRLAQKKLRKARKALSRKQKGSNRKEKARAKTARAHARVADARRDFHHKLSTKIIRENQAVYVEDLMVKGLARTPLAKSVHDAGWSSFTRMLEYKARLYGREFRKVGRFEPTTQVCSACGVKDGPKPLHVRQWTCAQCGMVHDRDVNAAKEYSRPGTQGGSKRPWRPGKTAGDSGTGQRNGKPQRCCMTRHRLNSCLLSREFVN